MSADHDQPRFLGSIPSPEEMQRQLNDMLRKSWEAARAQETSGVKAGAREEEGTLDEDEHGKEEDPALRFAYRPREVKAHLDRFVIRQEEAKKVLSVALCDHYNEVKRALKGKPSPHYVKQNVILLGPTGVGKTHLIRSLAELIGVPFVKADATKFSETGYVGGDVEDLVRDLVRKANGSVERAKYGIIFVDEIDKIASASQGHGRDVSGRGVQTNLLKLMEDTEVPARAPHDISGQIQALMEGPRGGKTGPATIPTKHILFVVSGAFSGLEKIVEKRKKEGSIGFAQMADEAAAQRGGASGVMGGVETRDFVEFGFEPEFIGRLPVRVACHALDAGDLHQILKTAEGSILKQYEQSFEAYGIEMRVKEEGMRRIAELAHAEKTGARGLMTVCERTFREFKFELPSTVVREFEVDRALVDDPGAALARLRWEHEREERWSQRREVDRFVRKFEEEHGMKLRFSEEASMRLVELAIQAGKPVSEICGQRFKDFPFGLRLVIQNGGVNEFELGVDGVDSPDAVLSRWVVESYGRKAGG